MSFELGITVSPEMRQQILSELLADDRNGREFSGTVLDLAENYGIYPDGIVLKYENKRIAEVAVNAVLAGS
jgi:hypothetical protein